MLIINSGTESVNSTRNSMTELEILAFNKKFTKYEGKNKSGLQVLQLLKTINVNNSSNNTKIAVKLSNLSGTKTVLDNCRYVIYDESNKLIKGSSSNIVLLDEIISTVDSYKAYTYDVTFYYCNPKTQSTSNNRHLNPMLGCVVMVNIEKN